MVIHEVVDKTDDVVFRCTLNGSAADRWLEVPAWMFDRTRCLAAAADRIAFCQHGCAVGAVRSFAAGIEGHRGLIECAAFWRIQILSRPKSGRGP